MAKEKKLSVLALAIDRISPVMRAINRSMRSVGRQFGAIGRAGDVLSAKLGVPLSLLGGASVAGVGAAVLSFAALGSQINDTAAKIGIGTDALQQFQVAGQLSGVANEDLANGLVKLNKGLAEAAAGKNKDLAGLFARLKIPLRDASGQVRDAASVLPQLADAMQLNTNAAVRTRIATVAFGKAGAVLIPMLKDGGANLREVAERAQRLGVIMDQSAVKSADALGDSIDWLKLATRGLANTIGAQLAPVLTPMIDRLTEWFGANRQIIAGRVEAVIVRIARAIETTDWDAISASLGRLWDRIETVVAAIGGWENALIGLVAIANASVIVALGQIGMAILRLIPIIFGLGKALLVFAIANPIIAGVVLAIGALAYAAYTVYTHWEPIKAWFVNLWADVKRIFVQNIADLVTTIVPFAGLLDKITGGKITASINSLVGNTPAGAAAVAPSLPGPQGQRLNGEITVRMENAPPGTRVSAGTTNQPGMALNPDVGYSSYAQGMM